MNPSADIAAPAIPEKPSIARNLLSLRAFLVSLVVGQVLLMVNQWDALFGSEPLDLGKAVVCFVVPYFVSVLASWPNRPRDKAAQEFAQAANENQMTSVGEASGEVAIDESLAMDASEQVSIEAGISRAVIDEELIANVQQIVSTIGENAHRVNQASKARASFVNELINVAREMQSQLERCAETVNSAGNQLDHANEGAHTASDRANEICNSAMKSAEASDKAKATVNVLREQFGNIQDLASEISQIANQTRLLSLNATIEAARAGDMGKGFAVVASEVKTLAGAADAAANKISDLSQNLDQSVSQTTAAIEGVGAQLADAIEHGGEANNAITGASSDISQVKGQALEVSQEIDRSVGNFKDILDKLDQVGRDSEQAISGSQINMELTEDALELITRMHA